jgi:hypothetical protein
VTKTLFFRIVRYETRIVLYGWQQDSVLRYVNLTKPRAFCVLAYTSYTGVEKMQNRSTDRRLAGRVCTKPSGASVEERKRAALEDAASELLVTGRLPACPRDVRPPEWLERKRAAARAACEASAAQVAREAAERRQRLAKIEAARLEGERQKLVADRQRRAEWRSTVFPTDA